MFRRDATDRAFARYRRRGDADALGEVFDRTAAELLRVALYLSGNRADAEDLVQRTFLAAIEARARFDPRQRVMPWLCGIVVNLARGLQRERARRQRLADAAPPAVPEPEPAAAAAQRELAERLSLLRAELVSPYREVLELHLEQGLGAKEIAAKLERPPGTVRTQLVRALELLRRRLPSGFVAGFAPLLPPVAALAPLRAAVVEAAGRALPAAMAGGATSIAATGAITSGAMTGGAMMTNKLVLGAPVLLLLAAGVWLGWPRTQPPSVEENIASAAVAAAPSAPATSSPLPAPPERQALAEPSADEPGFGSLRVFVHWTDGAPAGGIGVAAEGSGAAHNECRTGVTGADGSCLLPHLRPAPWRVRTTHGEDAQTLTIEPGEQRCSFTAAAPATLRGRVVDERQQPVQGAEIWIARSPRNAPQFAVAHSGADGRFALPLAMRALVGARCPGHVGTLAESVDPAALPGELVLRLRGAGGTVRGHVRDARGEPIAWARVVVGRLVAVPASTNSSYEPQRFDARGCEVATDADGTYEVPGVQPGRDVVQAWAPGFGVATQQVTVDTGITICDFALPAGASVQGQVRDGDGRGVADASVQLADEGWFVSFAANTDAEGSYRLDGLPPGSRTLRARAGNRRASGPVLLAAGATARWDAGLQAVPTVRGRVLRSDGAAAAGVTVAVAMGDLPHGAATRTDAEGAFALQPDDFGPVDLVAGEFGQPPLAKARGVRAGADDVVLRIADDAPSAGIRGRVVDAAGAPLAATISASRPGEAVSRTAQTGDDGRFTFASLRAGRYWLRIATPAHGFLSLPTFDLAAGAHRDIGEQVFAAPGAATITVREDDGSPARAYVTLYDDGGQWVAGANTEGGRARFAALQPRRYFVCVGGMPRAACGEVDVQPAAEAFADLQLVQVGRATLQVLGAGGSGITVLAFAAGRFAGMFGSRGEGPVGLWLPPGSYTLDVRAEDGRRATAELTIAGPDDHPECAVELPAK